MTAFNASDEVPNPANSAERRFGERHMTLYRVGSMTIDGRLELCLIRNISAGGMMVRPYCSISEGLRIIVELKCGQQIEGHVCWVRDNLAGVAFDQPIDVADLLSSTSQGPRPRMPRILIDNVATLRQGANIFRVASCDISQGGAKLRCDEVLEIDGDAVLSLPGLDPQPSVVRWQQDGHAGLNFNSLLPLADLVRWLQDNR